MARTKSRFRKGTAPGAASSPVRRDLDTLIQGISQQPPHLRLPGQGARQINGWSSPVEGLTKRNPMRLVSKVSDTPLLDFYLEMMDIQQGEQYSVFVSPTEGDSTITLDIRDLGTNPAVSVHGTGMTLINGSVICDSTSYLYNQPGSLYKNYALINSGAVGLLLNREKVAEMSNATSPNQTGKGLIFIRAVAYDVTYTVSIDGTEVATFTTPEPDADDNTISTTLVAESLKNTLKALDGYNATREQYVVYVQKDNGKDFEISIDDSRSNELATAFTNKVQTIAQLPTIAPDGYIVEVESDPSTTLDNRWLKFTTFGQGTQSLSADFSEGSWQETVKPGIKYRLDVDTMPIVIYRAAHDVIFVGPADGSQQSQTVNGTPYVYTFPLWGERSAGDETTTPGPEFIDKQIRDHVIFRGRYMVCAGETVQLSETDDIFNFFNDTSLTVQATDPFGLRAISERSSPIEWLLPVEDSVLAFSSTAQFQVRAADSDALTPLTGEMFVSSNLEMNSNVKPKLAGSQVLFATDYFGFTHFREYNYYNQRNAKQGVNLGSALDITNYVPKYIEGSITHWDVGQDIDAAVIISPTDKTKAFIYKYLWATGEVGQQKIQRSWSEWHFNQEIQWVKFMDNAIYLLVTDASGTYFNVQLNDEIEQLSAPQIHLDRLVQYPSTGAASASVTGSYDSGTDVTTFTIPYAPADKTVAVVRFTNDESQGLKLGETETTTLVCTEKGDWTGADVAFGEPYQFEYEFNTGYAPDKNSSQTRIIGQLAGRTQILRWTVNHVDTGAYTVRVKRQNRANDTVVDFRALTLDVANTELDVTSNALANGSIDVPVCSRNDRCSVSVESDSWLPVTITSASWKGVYSDREKAI